MQERQINVEEAIAALDVKSREKMARLALAGFQFIPVVQGMNTWEVVEPDGEQERAISLWHAIEMYKEEEIGRFIAPWYNRRFGG